MAMNADALRQNFWNGVNEIFSRLLMSRITSTTRVAKPSRAATAFATLLTMLRDGFVQ